MGFLGNPVRFSRAPCGTCAGGLRCVLGRGTLGSRSEKVGYLRVGCSTTAYWWPILGFPGAANPELRVRRELAEYHVEGVDAFVSTKIDGRGT